MKSFLVLVFLWISGMVHAQYKNDNVLFKTVHPADLSATLKQNPGYLILDVRTKGEHYDTSSMGLNIGRFKAAQNIDVRELPKRWNEIAEYKDRPVFVYCSHSQRSRRASKMLVDSGFTKVFNINGGMTAFHYLDVKNKEGIKELYETSANFRFISPQALCSEIKKGSAKIIDVRSDSAFEHITGDAKVNSLGSFRSAQHIALNTLQDRMEVFEKTDPIVFTDPFGGESVKAAQLFAQNGFTNVSVLLEGVDRWLLSDASTIQCRTEYISPVKFKIINAYDLGKLPQNYVALDVRSTDEFNNTHTDAFRNIGALRNAVNIPYDSFDEFSDQLKNYKKMQVIVYDFSGGRNAYATAAKLSQNGFNNVSVLAGGIFNLRWTSANMKGQKHLTKLVSGVPEANL